MSKHLWLTSSQIFLLQFCKKKPPFFRIYILLATIIFEYKLKTYLAFFSFTQEPLMCCVLIVWWDPYLYFKKCVAVVFLQSLMTNYLTEDRLKFYVYDTKTCCFLNFCFYYQLLSNCFIRFIKHRSFIQSQWH